MAILSTAIWLALPSVDGLAGLEVGAERGVAPRLAVALATSVRNSATGDYDGWIAGVAGEVRWFWRGRGRWSQIADTDRDGWFVGGRVDLGYSWLSTDDRSVGRTVIGGVGGELGYRVTPWRELIVTGLVGLGHRWERDTEGRLPGHDKGTASVGLEVGWMF